MARSWKDGEQRELVIQQCPYALSNRGFEIGGVIVGPPQVETNNKPAPSSPARARVATMLSIFVGHPSIASDHFGTIDKALACWSTGDKALANLRLIFAGLPPAASSESIDHLKLAAQITDAGLSPETLMNAIWPGAAPVFFAKYREDQPRVPAHHGRESGRWTSSDGDASFTVAAGEKPILEDRKLEELRELTGQETFEEEVAHHRPFDPLDQMPAGIGVGPYAGRSIPAGPSARPLTGQQQSIDAIGKESGCHTCGTTNPGIGAKGFIGDHQPPSSLRSPGETARYFPQCVKCSLRQGGLLRQYLIRRSKR